jgi:hypothetical protein
VSVRGSPELHFESLKLLSFDLNVDSDQAFLSATLIRIQLFSSMRIQLQLPKTVLLHADPDP